MGVAEKLPKLAATEVVPTPIMLWPNSSSDCPRVNVHHVTSSNGSLTHTFPLPESMRMRTVSGVLITVRAVRPAMIDAGISKL